MPDNPNTSLDFKLGELTGQISSMVMSFNAFGRSMENLEKKFEAALDNIEKRLDANHEVTTLLKFKMTIIGVGGGAVGGVLVTLIQALILKKFSL